MIKLWRLLKIILICLFIFLWSSPSYALTIEDVINPRQTYGGWVTDMASILSDKTENHLNKKISQLESKNGVEIAVVTVPETSPEPSPKAFATKLFNYWGIGKENENSGILFLVSVNEHRVEIETGLGIEPILSNSQIAEIVEQDITPLFKQQKFDLGILIAVDDLIAEVGSGSETNMFSIQFVMQAFMLLYLLFIFVSAAVALTFGIRNKDKYLEYKEVKSSNYGEQNVYGSSSSSSDFGGGSSDGGGAGGDW